MLAVMSLPPKVRPLRLAPSQGLELESESASHKAQDLFSNLSASTVNRPSLGSLKKTLSALVHLRR
jgi:hypothetical protein